MISYSRAHSVTFPAYTESVSLFRQIINNIGRLFALSFISITVGGCSSLYFHSDSDQKLIDEAQKGFAAAKTSQLSALDVRTGLVATEVARQRQAVIEDELSLRDNQISVLMDEARSTDKAMTIRENLQVRLNVIVGADEAASVLGKSVNLDKILMLIEQSRRRAQSRELAVLEDARKAGISLPKKDVAGYCAPAGRSQDPQLSISSGSLVDDTLLESCINYNDVVATNYKYISDLTNAQSIAVSGEGGQLGGVRTDLNLAERLAQAQAMVVKATDKSLQDAKNYYECQKEADKAAGIDDNLRKAAAIIVRFAAPPASATASDATSNITAAAKASSKCKKSETFWDAAFRNQGLKPEDITLLLKEAKGFEPLNVLAAKLGETQAKFAQSELGKGIIAVAKDSAAQPTQTTTTGAVTTKSKSETIAVETVKLLGFIEDYERAASGQLPDIPAALIGLARAQLVTDLASVALNRFEREKELLTLQRDGLLNEVYLLNKAGEELNHGRLNRAILLRGDAWSKGELPYRVASWDRKNLLYEDWADQQRAIAKANYETLEPVVALLQEYGAGGVSGKDLANWLGALAAVAIAYGVN